MDFKKPAKIIIGLAILAGTLYYIGFESIVENFSKMDIIYLPAVLIFSLASIFINSLNLFLLGNLFQKLSVSKAFDFVFTSFAATMVTPGRLGQISIVYMLKKHGFELGEATALVFVDKAVTIFVLSVFGSMGILLLMPREFFLQVLALLTAGWTGGLFFFYSEFGRNIIKKFVLGKHQELFTGFKKSIDIIVAEKKALIKNIFLTFIRLNITALTEYALIISLGGSVDYILLLLISAVTQLLSFVPLTPNGLGIKEGGFSFLATLIGVPLGIAGTTIFTMTILNYFYSAVYTAFFIQKTHFSKIGAD